MDSLGRFKLRLDEAEDGSGLERALEKGEQLPPHEPMTSPVTPGPDPPAAGSEAGEADMLDLVTHAFAFPPARKVILGVDQVTDAFGILGLDCSEDAAEHLMGKDIPSAAAARGLKPQFITVATFREAFGLSFFTEAAAGRHGLTMDDVRARLSTWEQTRRAAVKAARTAQTLKQLESISAHPGQQGKGAAAEEEWGQIPTPEQQILSMSAIADEPSLWACLPCQSGPPECPVCRHCHVNGTACSTCGHVGQRWDGLRLTKPVRVPAPPSDLPTIVAVPLIEPFVPTHKGRCGLWSCGQQNNPDASYCGLCSTELGPVKKPPPFKKADFDNCAGMFPQASPSEVRRALISAPDNAPGMLLNILEQKSSRLARNLRYETQPWDHSQSSWESLARSENFRYGRYQNDRLARSRSLPATPLTTPEKDSRNDGSDGSDDSMPRLLDFGDDVVIEEVD